MISSVMTSRFSMTFTTDSPDFSIFSENSLTATIACLSAFSRSPTSLITGSSPLHVPNRRAIICPTITASPGLSASFGDNS